MARSLQTNVNVYLKEELGRPAVFTKAYMPHQSHRSWPAFCAQRLLNCSGAASSHLGQVGPLKGRAIWAGQALGEGPPVQPASSISDYRGCRPQPYPHRGADSTGGGAREAGPGSLGAWRSGGGGGGGQGRRAHPCLSEPSHRAHHPGPSG